MTRGAAELTVSRRLFCSSRSICGSKPFPPHHFVWTSACLSDLAGWSPPGLAQAGSAPPIPNNTGTFSPKALGVEAQLLQPFKALCGPVGSCHSPSTPLQSPFPLYQPGYVLHT